MEKEYQEKTRNFGLLGRNISYSFSRQYFSDKFRKEGLNATYVNFDLADISQLQQVLAENPELEGFNVTIPYKEEVLPFLDLIDPIAEKIGAVNTVKILKDGRLQGYNTDYVGFSEAIKPL